MKKTKKTKGRSLLDNKRVVLVLSFIVAVIAWVIIGGWIKPNDARTIDNVVIDYTRNSSNYKNRDLEIVGDYPETVSVKVSGDGNILLDLASTDIIVYPDYSAVNDAGTYEIPLRAVREGSGFAIDEWSPDTISLQFEKVHRSSYTLSVQSDGITAETGYYKDEAVPSTLQVEVTGPEGEMEMIAGATEIIDDNAVRTTSYTASNAEVVLVDKNGDILQTSDLVSVNPSVVTVDIPILPTKQLDLVVGFTGAPTGFDEEWFESLINLTKRTITVAGEAALLENIDELPVGNIDISTFEIGKTYESFDIMLPDGLKDLDGVQSVGVSLNFSTLSQQSFDIPLADIKAYGGPDGLEIEPADILDENATYRVTLIGDADVINGLLPENIAVQIYASAVEAGGNEQQELPVMVYVPRSGQVFSTGEYTILCNITEVVEDDSDASGS